MLEYDMWRSMQKDTIFDKIWRSVLMAGIVLTPILGILLLILGIMVKYNE